MDYFFTIRYFCEISLSFAKTENGTAITGDCVSVLRYNEICLLERCSLPDYTAFYDSIVFLQ